ncbi:MAG TPA: ribosome assembly cofactor RimP, partial [Bacteroidaceae bacterium]|nr:ribosome assembly cofactor RimP [Bacteroidaceae bacterium]
MIEKETVRKFVSEYMEGTDLFIVEIAVHSGNNIQVLVDSPEGISIDTCVEISEFLNRKMDRDSEDYSLEVSSPGLGSPFKVREQYEKNIGRDVEVVLNNGIKIEGRLLNVTDERIFIEVLQKVADEKGQGKKGTVPVRTEIGFNEIKTIRAV